MLRLHGIRGYETDAAFRGRLHHLQHRDGIGWRAGRTRVPLSTDRETGCVVRLDRDAALGDGAILDNDAGRAIAARVGRQTVWRLGTAADDVTEVDDV